MDINQFVSTAQDALSVRRVFADPYVQDGTTVIAAARVTGGGGGGTGEDATGPQGEGGGFGINAAPIGAFVIRDGNVRWVPAIDPHRIIGAVAAVVVTLILTRGYVETRAIRAGLRTARS